MPTTALSARARVAAITAIGVSFSLTAGFALILWIRTRR